MNNIIIFIGSYLKKYEVNRGKWHIANSLPFLELSFITNSYLRQNLSTWRRSLICIIYEFSKVFLKLTEPSRINMIYLF